MYILIVVFILYISNAKLNLYFLISSTMVHFFTNKLFISLAIFLLLGFKLLKIVDIFLGNF